MEALTPFGKADEAGLPGGGFGSGSADPRACSLAAQGSPHDECISLELALSQDAWHIAGQQ
jgi:hypothetical protein